MRKALALAVVFALALHSGDAAKKRSSRGGGGGGGGDDKDEISSMAESTAAERLTKAAMKLVAEGKEGDAVAKFEEAAELEPGVTGRWVNLGSVYNALGRTGDAASAFKRGLRLSPNDDLLKTNLKGLGKEYAWTAEDEAEAKAEVLARRAAVMSEFDDEEAAAAPKKKEKKKDKKKGKKEKIKTPPKKKKEAGSGGESGGESGDGLEDMAATTPAEKITKAAMKLVAEGKTEEALAQFEEAAAREPKDPGRWANLGSSHAGLGNKAEAAAAFNRGLSLKPKDSLLRKNLKALGKEFAATPAMKLRAETLAEEAAEAAAVEAAAVEAAVPANGLASTDGDSDADADPDRLAGEAASVEGIAFAQEAKPKRALKAFQKAVKLVPNNAGYWANLGSAYNTLGKPSEAAAAFKRGLRLAPGDALLLENLASLGEAFGFTAREVEAAAAKEAEEEAARAARASRRRALLAEGGGGGAPANATAEATKEAEGDAQQAQQAAAKKEAKAAKVKTEALGGGGGGGGGGLSASSHADVAEDPAAKRLVKEGIAFAQGGKPRLAVRAFKKAIALDGTNAGYWANLGRAQLDLGLSSEAAASFSRGLEEARDQPELVDLLTENLKHCTADAGGGGEGGGGGKEGAASEGEASVGPAAPLEVEVVAAGGEPQLVDVKASAKAATAAKAKAGADATTKAPPPFPVPRQPAHAPKGSGPHGQRVSYVTCGTTKGPITLAVFDAWAPNGAARFLELVTSGFFSSKVGLFRAVENFMVQFGISGDPELSSKWGSQRIPDDPQWLPAGPRRFKRGFISFAGGGPNSRTTQLFLAYAGLSLGDAPHEVPFGQLVGEESLEVLDSWYKGYGEMGAFGGNAPDQGKMATEGLPYLEKGFPKLDYITGCDVTWQSDWTA